MRASEHFARHAVGKLVIAGVSLCVLAAACSSTTTLAADDVRTVGGPSPDGSGALSADGSTADAGGQSVSGEGGTATGPGASPDGANPFSGGSSVSGVTSGSGSGRTTCSGKVKVGVTFVGDTEQAKNAIGSIDPVSDSKAQRQLAVDHINKTGGFGGCQIEPVWFSWTAITAEGDEAQSQRECVTYTEDNQVLVALPIHFATRSFMDCMASRKTPVVRGRLYSIYTQDDFAKRYRGLLYGPNLINADRMGPFIDELADRGFFEKGARLGLITPDDGTGVPKYLMDKIWKPRLAARGVKVVSEASPRPIQGFATVGDKSAEDSSTVLQFKSANVTHVLAAPPWILGSNYFRQAENQDFRPRYAFTSAEGAAGASAEIESYHRAVVISSDPMADNYYDTPGWPKNKASERCARIYEGLELDLFKMSFCDRLFFLQAAFDRASEVSQRGLLSAVESLGTDFQSPNSYGAVRFGPGRYDGGTYVRALTFDPKTENWVPMANAKPRRIP